MKVFPQNHGRNTNFVLTSKHGWNVSSSNMFERLDASGQPAHSLFVLSLLHKYTKLLSTVSSTSLLKKNLYKALVDAYESDKDILASYGDTVTLKRRRDDEDDDEEPSVGSNRGSKIRRARKEPESTSASKEKTSKPTGKSKEGSKSHQKSTDNTLSQNEDHRESFNELMDTPLDFSAFVLNRLKVDDTLTPELLAGPKFELMKGSCKSLVELEYFLGEVCKATTDQLD
ncbi:hypothetical protein Tco_1279261 [Tanacetum coccineum]